MAKNKMPRKLLEHFKKKAAEKEGKDVKTDENKKESDNSRRKKAVKKARLKIKEKSRYINVKSRKKIEQAS